MPNKARSNSTWVKHVVPAFTLLILALTLVAGLATAQNAGNQSEAPSPLAAFAPTTAELLAMPPSIERYVAAHTLPLSARSAAGLDKVDVATFSYLPLTTFGLAPEPGQVTLTVGEPNGLNAWPVSWTADPLATRYELQEAHQSDFSDAQSINAGQQTSMLLTRTPSPQNVYYYRVRSLIGGQAGPWSNVGRVVGGFRDDFEDPGSGWAMRRTTYIEEVHSRYQDGYLVLDVNDRWDWGITSPGMPAPRVPYVIDFFAMIDGGGANLWSFGAIFGGDWPAAQCPMSTDADGWYMHGDCFNQFYNTNTIFYGPLKLLFERVDHLEWCLDCGGSPLKRLGDINPGSIKTLKLVDPTGWNHYRVEVREDIIKIYAAKIGFTPELQYTYRDTRYIDNDYFGLFASTDEYTNGIWWFDNFQVMPLD
jgi:hypothetical protein